MEQGQRQKDPGTLDLLVLDHGILGVLGLEVAEIRTLGLLDLMVLDTGILGALDLVIVKIGVLEALDLQVLGQIVQAMGTPGLPTQTGVNLKR